MEVVEEMFTGRLILLRGVDLSWSARFPDLFPWHCEGYLKANVFNYHPRNLEELKIALREEIVAIQPELLEKSLQN